jgi:glutamate synthase (NADPH/NADH) large chain
VYDPDGSFPTRVNTGMVSLEELDDEDRTRVRDLVAQHLAETGSGVAERLLADWDRAVPSFTKVMPDDYKRVLEATRLAEAEGRDVIEAVMEASRNG